MGIVSWKIEDKFVHYHPMHQEVISSISRTIKQMRDSGLNPMYVIMTPQCYKKYVAVISYKIQSEDPITHDSIDNVRIIVSDKIGVGLEGYEYDVVLNPAEEFARL